MKPEEESERDREKRPRLCRYILVFGIKYSKYIVYCSFFVRIDRTVMVYGTSYHAVNTRNRRIRYAN